MKAWEFSKARHLQKLNGWSQFISMQNNYNLLAREEEREMMPLCADEGVQAIICSPLARGRLARSWNEKTTRSEDEKTYGAMYETTAESDKKIIEEVGKVAIERGVTQVQIALSWLWRNPIVAAPIIGALKTKHIDDALAALSITLTADEVTRLERPYTAKVDYQNISDPVVLIRAAEKATDFKMSA